MGIILLSLFAFGFMLLLFQSSFSQKRKEPAHSADFQGNCGRMLSQFDCFL